MKHLTAPKSTRMHILFVNQFFWPDEAPTGRLLEDLCHVLAAQGHEVSIICGPSEYRGRSERPAPPANIIRVPALRFSKDGRTRMISWFSFLIAAGVRAMGVKRPNLIVAMTTPPGLSLAMLPACLLRRSRLWIWEMDVYPDVAAATSIVSAKSWAFRCIRGSIDFSRRAADGIVALGECMRRRLIGHGLSPDKVHVHENWTEVGEVPPIRYVAGQKLRVLYSGNLGLAHDVETIRAVLLRMKDHGGVEFVFAGGGAQRPALEEFCRVKGLCNVSFRSHLDQGAFRKELGDCHLGLVTLRKECVGTVVPSKFYSLMAAQRPALFIGPPDATPAERIRSGHCGWSFEPGDVDGVVKVLERMRKTPKLLLDASGNAGAVHSHQLTRDLLAGRLAARFTGAREEPESAAISTMEARG